MADDASVFGRRPIVARIAAPAGPPEPRLCARAGAAVLSVPGRYCMMHILIGDEAVAVVDVGSEADLARLAAALRLLGRTFAAVSCAVVTHLHFDHALGVVPLARRCGCPAGVSKRAFDALNGGPELRLPPPAAMPELLRGWVMQGLPVFTSGDFALLRKVGLRPRADALGVPLLSLGEGDGLPGVPGWKVLFTPGHADDAMALYHEAAQFLVTGDTVRNFLGGEWNPVRTDREAFDQTRARLTSLPVRTVFPGHGPVIEGERVLHRLMDPNAGRAQQP